MFMYKQINSNDEDTDIVGSEKIGGIFEIVNPDLKFTVLDLVMEGDFESEYPSIIINFNISPETLEKDSS